MGINTWCYITPTARVTSEMDFTYLEKDCSYLEKAMIAVQSKKGMAPQENDIWHRPILKGPRETLLSQW